VGNPSYRYSKRKTARNTVKTERGWLDVTDQYGDLKVTVYGDRTGVYHTAADPRRIAFKTSTRLASNTALWCIPAVRRLGDI